MVKINEKEPAVREFREASAKLAELQRELGAADREIVELSSKLEALSQGRGGQQDGLVLEAQAYLAGGEISTEAPDRASIKGSLAGLNRKRDVIERATILQKQIVDRARGQYSLVVNAEAEPAHNAIVLRMGPSLSRACCCL